MIWILASLLVMNIQPVSDGVPNRQPQLASGHGLVALTFVAGQSMYFASSEDDGRTFSPPIKVAEVQNVAAGRHRGPRVAILKDAIVISAVVFPRAGSKPPADGSGDDGNLIAWRSLDRGKTWSRAGVVNDVPGSAREGLHAMAADGQGNLFATWLDHRTKGTKLYGSRSTDGGVTWSTNVLVYASPDGNICECCHPSLAIDGQGQISAMWRNWLGGSRDLYVSSSRDGATFSPAQKLGSGTWKLNACPMDGGGLAVDRGQLVSAWRRDGQVFLASPGKQETLIGPGKDAAVAAGRKGVYVAWSEGAAVAILTPGATKPMQLAAEGAFVSLSAAADGSIVAAWESGGSIQLQRIGH